MSPQPDMLLAQEDFGVLMLGYDVFRSFESEGEAFEQFVFCFNFTDLFIKF